MSTISNVCFIQLFIVKHTHQYKEENKKEWDRKKKQQLINTAATAVVVVVGKHFGYVSMYIKGLTFFQS